MEKDGNVKIGLDDFIQHITGTISCIKMKESGEIIRKGEKIVTIIKDGKRLDIYSPVSGVIKEKNTNLILNSSLINSSTYSDGWVYSIEPKNWGRETQFLFMSEKYKSWINDEFIRLKDFLSKSVKFNVSAYEHIILQDGGEITDNVLADLEPEVWEDFQTNFINTSK
jgi:glycine cleavage system H lipoate-binding protein